MIKQYKNIFIELYGVVVKEPEESDLFTLNEGFTEFAEAIKDKYDLYLISNDDTCKHKDITDRLGLDGYFKERFIGSEMDCKKPRFEIFDKALEIIGAAPAECIFVDCDIKSILAAEEVGMSPIMFYRDGDRFYDSTVYNFDELRQFV